MKRIVMLLMLLVITISVTAAGSEVYFNPQEGSAEFCEDVKMELWANAAGFQGGQINLIYNPSCANVTGWERSTTNFLIGGWSHYDGRDWITFATMDPQPILLTGNYMIGTLTIHCVYESGESCETPLAFIAPSRLLDDRGNPVSANWTNGTFSCKNECEGTDTSCGIYPNCENCNEYDGCYVYGNGCEDRDSYCKSNEAGCNYTCSNRHTDYYDDWVYYCKGDDVWKHRLFHDFYCEGGTCTDHTSWEDDQLVVGTPEDGCCEYDGNCYSGTLDPAVCEVCYGGTWYPGKKCCDGNCYECCTDADCQEGYICNPETHKCEEEVPEFPAGVTAVFGACVLMFLMIRRKYVRK